MSAPSPGRLLDNVLMFGRLLRSLGLEIHVGRVLDAVRALEHVGVARRDDFYCTLRAMLIHRHDDFAIFDEAFAAFWHARRVARRVPGRDLRSLGERPRFDTSQWPRGDAGREGRSSGAGPSFIPTTSHLVAAHPVWSDVETLRTKDFAHYSADELAEAQIFLSELRWRPGERRTRRWAPGGGTNIDWRRLLRQNGQGTEVVVLPHRRRRLRMRPVIVLADVSGSMTRYARILLRFAYCLVRDRGRVEAFAFATRLTRITRDLGRGDIDGAASAAERHVQDWAGGTRIGEALGTFNREWRGRLLRGGPVALVISDGWDRGDPARLAREVALLQRSCHRLIWLNPLLGSPGYEPLTRGLRAALPFVDDFLPIRNLDSLVALARHLNALGSRAGRGGSSDPPTPWRRTSRAVSPLRDRRV